MITAVDTNIIAGILEGEEALADRLAVTLDRLADQGALVIAPIVYAELLAAPFRSPAIVDAFLTQTPVRVDWTLEEAIWRAAGLAYRAYVRQRQADVAEAGARRLLADFIIGAHAVHRHATLLTWDERIYRTYFPTLVIVAP